MRVFKTKWFARYTRKEGIDEKVLVEAIREVEKGLLDADYGCGLIKKRIARDGAGKSGGYRSIIAYRSGTRSVLLYCFAKSDIENLKKGEVTAYKMITAKYFGFSDAEIASALKNGELEEVEYNDDKI